MSLLGQIIAGESATPAGQQAVLNVIQNRAAINFGGYGTSLISQATAGSHGVYQFSAYPNALGVPTANTESLISQAQAGTLGNIVPNSLNYANPAGVTNPNSWVWGAVNSGQGVTIGGNTFWENSYGGSPGYDPSQLAGGGAAGGYDPFASGEAAVTDNQGLSVGGAGAFVPGLDYGSSGGIASNGNAATTNLPGLPYGSDTGGAQTPFGDFGGLGTGVIGGGPDAGGVGGSIGGILQGVLGGQPFTGTLIGGGQGEVIKSVNPNVAVDSSGNVTDLTKAETGQGNLVSAVTGVGKAITGSVTGAAQTTTQAVTGWLTGYLNNLGQWLFRAGGVALGLVLILVAGLMVYKGTQS